MSTSGFGAKRKRAHDPPLNAQLKATRHMFTPTNPLSYQHRPPQTADPDPAANKSRFNNPVTNNRRKPQHTGQRRAQGLDEPDQLDPYPQRSVFAKRKKILEPAAAPSYTDPDPSGFLLGDDVTPTRRRLNTDGSLRAPANQTRTMVAGARKTVADPYFPISETKLGRISAARKRLTPPSEDEGGPSDSDSDDSSSSSDPEDSVPESDEHTTPGSQKIPVKSSRTQPPLRLPVLTDRPYRRRLPFLMRNLPAHLRIYPRDLNDHPKFIVRSHAHNVYDNYERMGWNQLCCPLFIWCRANNWIFSCRGNLEEHLRKEHPEFPFQWRTRQEDFGAELAIFNPPPLPNASRYRSLMFVGKGHRLYRQNTRGNGLVTVNTPTRLRSQRLSLGSMYGDTPRASHQPSVAPREPHQPTPSSPSQTSSPPVSHTVEHLSLTEVPIKYDPEEEDIRSSRTLTGSIEPYPIQYNIQKREPEDHDMDDAIVDDDWPEDSQGRRRPLDLPDKYLDPPPKSDPFGPAARKPYLCSESPGLSRSYRVGGEKIYDILSELPTAEFGLMLWEIQDLQEEIYESDDLDDEMKAMYALWTRWIFWPENRLTFHRDGLTGLKDFLDKYWQMVHRCCGFAVLRKFLVTLLANRLLKPNQLKRTIKYYTILTGMDYWDPRPVGP
ncbi:hypothetical protein DL96DRAFT_1593848 [Flagelloscypha sp. PMI_526]|nr:hypothetical protein DL96DRAFT_1593848 [Flagelloscypha sp. PMI_526]